MNLCAISEQMKMNVTDKWTDGRTDGQTDGHRATA